MSDQFKDFLTDEFDRISLLTILENEFKIILIETVFDNLENLDQFAHYIIQDEKAY